MLGETFSELSLSAQGHILQKELNWHKSLPGSFMNQKRLTHLGRRNYKLTRRSDKLCHKLPYLPSILLRAPSSFLKITYSP